MTDHESVWLEPPCCDAINRLWCEDPLVDCQECGAKATRYIRADIVESLRAELERMRMALEHLLTLREHAPPHDQGVRIRHAYFAGCFDRAERIARTTLETPAQVPAVPVTPAPAGNGAGEDQL